MRKDRCDNCRYAEKCEDGICMKGMLGELEEDFQPQTESDCNLFGVKIERNKYDLKSQENSITISVTHNGYQFSCISLSIEEAQVLRKKLGGWLDFFVD